ncbi:HTH-type transcriptional activator RhaR [Candidatus Entotheonellaceae bacterium PAL068K]
MDFALPAADCIFYQSSQLEISSSLVRTEHYPAHVHADQFQLEIVVGGATECGIGRQRYPVPQQCYSMVNPDVEHYNITRRWKHAWFIIFARQALDETAWQLYRLLSRSVMFSEVVAPCSAELTATVQFLFQEAAHPNRPGYRLVFDAALVQLSVVLLRSLQGNHSARPVAAFNARAHRAQIARAVDLIHGCFQDDLSLDDLARAAAMSRYHFLRCFKAQVGITPYAYLLQVRLQTAATLLQSSCHSITDIASMCGFVSPSRLSDAFRRAYHCSPSAYRRTHVH